MKKDEVQFYREDVFRTYDLNNTMREQLNILGTLDAFTRRHSENVANLTCRLCHKLNLDRGFTIYCTICAYLHDIGKMRIPPRVLQKPGKLTDEEYEIMKSHTTIGYNICMADPKLAPYSAGAYYHHEALDGSGYPRGVKGKDLVYEGQIIRVADVFDAIVSKRQYKSHVGIVDTLKIIQKDTIPKEKGSLFRKTYGKIDSKIFNCLVKLILEDTEFEIFQVTEYLEYLNNERKRYKDALKYYEKSQNAKKEDDKQYFHDYANGFLTTQEEFDKIPEYYADINAACEKKEQTIADLKKEYKEISKIKGY